MSEITYLQAVRDAISEEMRRDEDIFLMGEDIGIYGGCFGLSKGMLEEFGEDRIMDTPLSEAGFTGAQFRSNEWSDVSVRPQLVIEYVPEPATIGLLVLGGAALIRRRR